MTFISYSRIMKHFVEALLRMPPSHVHMELMINKLTLNLLSKWVSGLHFLKLFFFFLLLTFSVEDL